MGSGLSRGRTCRVPGTRADQLRDPARRPAAPRGSRAPGRAAGRAGPVGRPADSSSTPGRSPSTFASTTCHSTATLLLREGVALAVVSKLLRHSDPKITLGICGHLDVEDLREGLERLPFGKGPLVEGSRPAAPASGVNGAPVARTNATPGNEGPQAFAFARNLGAFRWSGRLDLNQRPLAPQRRFRAAHRMPLGAPARKGSKIRRPWRDAAAHQAHWAHRVSQGMGRIWGAECCR